ncbi:MAG: hypothetical protein ACI38A_02285 [Candidatus Ornithomonoglobus sp.]
MDIIERLELRDERRRESREKFDQLRRNRADIILVAVSCLVILLAGIYYVAKSRTIYFWDDSTYWELTRSLVNGELTGDGFWRSVYNSIGTLDYNYAAALPSALWMKIFGQSRIAFVAGLIVMYIVPSAILTYRMSIKLSKAPKTAFLLSVFIMPVTSFLAYNGFVDVGGLFIALCCYNLYYSAKGVSRGHYKYIIIGILLVLIMVFRRYFAFFSVSFITAMIADCIINRRNWRNLFLLIAVVAILLLTVFRPFMINILLKNYGSLYAGYKYSLATDMKIISRYFGMAFIIISAIVPFVSVIKRKEYRPVFLWIQIISCAAIFMAIQTHGQQHLLLYVPAFTVMTIFLVNCISKEWMLIGMCLLTVFNIGNTVIDREQPDNIQNISHYSFIPDFSLRPDEREDAEAILTLKRDLDALIPEWQQCKVLSSSLLLNDSILRNVEPSLGAETYRSPDYIKALPEVDSRDSDRLWEIYYADYILVAFPAQTYLAEGQQTITERLVESFANYTDVAQDFVEIYSFARQVGSLDVKLYQRINDVDELRQREFEAKLYK